MSLSVSVVIPVYNAEPYITECIESVLAQTYQPQQIIVINDGSTDQSLDKLMPYAQHRLIQLQTRENRGVAATLNEAIDLAEGDLIAFLDADDVWLPYKLQQQVTCLQTNPSVDACFGYVRQFISPDLPLAVQAGIHCPSEPQPGWLKQTMLIRRNAFQKTGLFSTVYHTGDFIDWFMRAKEAGLPYIMLPDTVTFRRLHRSGLASQQQYQKEFVHILKAALDRRASHSSTPYGSQQP
ncbi:glycosyltransferase family 2 protein [Spirosoma aerolatum]|uniref:glycosyltransferase family 2 protein n=1 Tax=Spirosoma aerolatum TaxID=1211326 RepID=UPI0009AC200E|nr:glycosyltransferase family A protein [Spirosoma aerolatum]